MLPFTTTTFDPQRANMQLSAAFLYPPRSKECQVEHWCGWHKYVCVGSKQRRLAAAVAQCVREAAAGEPLRHAVLLGASQCSSVC